jgi:lipopolysaccharide biosynthesis regulator YciM
VQHEAQNSLEQRLREDPAVMALQRAFDAQIVQVSPERSAPVSDATTES